VGNRGDERREGEAGEGRGRLEEAGGGVGKEVERVRWRGR